MKREWWMSSRSQEIKQGLHIERANTELLIDALCDGDCRRTDGFYWELGEVTTIEEMERLHEETQHENHPTER